MNPSVTAQANQAAQQGQQALAQDNSNASTYQEQYGNYQNQADQANQQLKSYTNYMQNAGNPQNLYNQQVSQAEQDQGFDPHTLATATQNLTQSQNALNSLNQASQSSTGGYGLSGAQLGGYYASQSQPLSNQVQNQNTAVGNLQQLYQNSLQSGQQGATLGFQGEQLTSQNLNQVYQNSQNQAAQALQQMQFYSQLAQSQGGMNATMAQNYAQAQQAYAAAQQAIAQSGFLLSQTTGQNLTNEQTQNAINAGNAAKSKGSPAPPVANKSNPATNNNAQKVAATNGLSNLNTVKSSQPTELQKFIGTGGASAVHKIGSLF